MDFSVRSWRTQVARPRSCPPAPNPCDKECERIVQQVEFPVLIASLKYFVPAQSPAENRALFAQLKNAPPEAWNALMDAVRPVMEAGEPMAVLGWLWPYPTP
jgi:hypothetical protein